MSGRVVPWTGNRQVIYDLLTRAKRFHCPVSSCWQLDISALESARREARARGAPVGLTACMVKATSLLLRRYPRFNQHMFHGLLRKRQVAFDRVRCNMIVMRRAPDGERILLPLILERSDELSVLDIQREIDRCRRSPLGELPEFLALERVKRTPRLLLRWFSYRVRSDPRFYARYFGSYGLSSLTSRGGSAHALHAVANTGSAFLFGSPVDAPVVRDGEVTVGRVLNLAVVVDHYLLDGLDVVEGVRYLRRLLADPARLGLGPDGGRGVPGGLPAPLQP